jgi:hypothetical protein
MKVQTVPSRLTDRAVLNAKPQPSRYKISDDYGLYLLVMPQGGKHWRFDYRFAGARRTLSIGPYPLFSLAEARDERDKARKLLRDGIDPGERRKQERAVEELTASATFSVIADDVLQRMEKERRAEATLTKTRWLLDFARPNLGNLPISKITAPQILAVLRKIEDRGRYETAKCLRNGIGSVFRYAIATGRATADPTYALRDALISPPATHFAAITDPDQVSELLRAIDGFEGQPGTHAALKLAPHVFVRPGELRTA